eukprot:CAMPEP_0184494914 /NCGR_PEP_ID=MMETSP0113_2-20130426/29938_1 /TAXON_ID=91329 /ORGANISM="Norrisiella sphaerica, Strain BC52" /LENGTH=174 /DNA_ID=CAMNT_0026880875 /DNA_START=475 /DNA_END=996 /DNA_ORIENTATION=+
MAAVYVSWRLAWKRAIGTTFIPRRRASGGAGGLERIRVMVDGSRRIHACLALRDRGPITQSGVRIISGLFLIPNADTDAARIGVLLVVPPPMDRTSLFDCRSPLSRPHRARSLNSVASCSSGSYDNIVFVFPATLSRLRRTLSLPAGHAGEELTRLGRRRQNVIIIIIIVIIII